MRSKTVGELRGSLVYTYSLPRAPKTEMLAKFHLSAADTKGVRVQFVQNLSYILLGVK